MKKKLLVLVLISFIMVIFSLQASAVTNGDRLLIPKANKSGPWRIVYCENDPYVNFAGFFYGIVKGLNELGWINSIEGIPYEEGSDNAGVMWQWLAQRDMGKYIEFVDDGFYQLISMSEEEKQNFMKRLMEREDTDLIIVMGTKASQIISSSVNSIPVISLSCTNAYKSGIIKSIEDSGQDNLWALIDPDIYIRQLDIFHELFNFEKLGIVYENSELGRAMSAVDDVHRFAGENNIEIVEKYVAEANSPDDLERYNQEIMEAYQDLATKVDAFYLTPGSRDATKTYRYLQPFYQNKVPVFNMEGISDVEYGALLTVQRYNFNEAGKFGADRIVRVLNGVKPRELKQRFPEKSSISINIAAAEKIGYQVPFEILLAADKIYTTIRED